MSFVELLPGVDANVSALANGLKVDFVAADPEAAGGLVEELTVPKGWTFEQGAGIILLLDENGKQAGVWAGGLAFDAGGENETDVGLELIETEGTLGVARVVVDEKWLTDPGRVYPVTIDPTDGTGGTTTTTTGGGGGGTKTVTVQATSYWDSPVFELEVNGVATDGPRTVTSSGMPYSLYTFQVPTGTQLNDLKITFDNIPAAALGIGWIEIDGHQYEASSTDVAKMGDYNSGCTTVLYTSVNVINCPG